MFSSDKKLAFPDAKWSDLFEKVGPRVHGARATKFVRRMPCGPHFSVRSQDGYESINVTPTDKLIEWALRNTIEVSHDTFDFQIVERDDNTWLCVMSHNQILGSHWLVIWTEKDLPEEVRATISYMKLRSASCPK